MICTWMECQLEATTPQLDRDGNEWANLCNGHARQLDAAIESGDAKRIVGAWARAGSKHRRRKDLTNNIAKGCGKLVGFLQKLKKE